MLNDKKNNDFKISLILLKRIGKTTAPGKFKITLNRMQKLIPKII
jgi:3-dehydroquinate synthetase